MKTHRANSAQEASGAEEPARSAALDELEDWLEEPVAWLGLVWLGLLVVETVGFPSAPGLSHLRHLGHFHR